ncbi:MAG: hypothetical protein Q7S57_02300 [bacterium]|nr:hypothetical protein [bacterium]
MKKILLVVIAIVVILGGALFLYAKRFTPEQRLQAAFVNLVKAVNGHLQAKVDIKTDPATSATLSEFKIDTDGNFQKGNGGQLDLDSSVVVEGSMTGASVIGKGAVRLVGGKLFYKLDEIPVALADITSIRGKWLPGTTNINLLPDAARANMVVLFQKPQLFTSIKQIGKEKVGTTNTTHFQTIFSASGYASFVEEFSKLSGNATPVSKADLENGVKALNNVPFDVWLDSGNKLRKVAVSYINPQNKANVSIELLLTNFVGKDKIAEPAQSEQITPAPATPVASVAPIVSPVATPATK